MKRLLIIFMMIMPMYLFGQPVPVVLSEFNAQALDWGVHISWEAESEVGFDYYEVQHRGDLYEWSVIATVYPKPNKEYSVSHVGGLFNGHNYYRLKMVDINGSYDYSDVVQVKFRKEHGDIKIYPNPATDHIQFYNTKERAAYIQFYDLNGRLALEGPFDCDRFEVNELPIGSYIIVISAGPLQEQKLFIKQ